VPTISRFYGIVIQMFYNDHAPPHFHAVYAGKGAVFTVSPVAKVHGRIPKRAHKMILQWARVNRAALLMDWEAARDHRALREIPPLE